MKMTNKIQNADTHSNIRTFDYSTNSHSTIRSFKHSIISSRPAFTLIEMLVVVGIIAVLVGASIGGFTKMTKSAEKAKAQELVSNVATALTALFQQEGAWPRRLARNGTSDGELDAETAYALVAGTTKYLSLTTENGKLAGLDRFGVVTPWATAAIKRKGSAATLSDKVFGSTTVKDHILHYALDLDGDGIIKGASVGGEGVDVRATAIVWCIGKSGGNKGQPWPYSKGRRADDVYSWTFGQTQQVK